MPEDEMYADGADDSQQTAASSPAADVLDDDDDSAPAPARVVPAEDDDDPDTPAAATGGPIPLADHKRILQRTRRELEGRLGALSWADGYERQRVERAMQIAQYYDTNPVGFHAYLGSHLGQGTQEPPPIQPEFETSDGAPLYSAAQVSQLLERHEAKLTDTWSRTLDARLTPIEQATRQQRQGEQLEAQIAEAQTWPGFAEHVGPITQVLARANRAGQQITLEQAYIRVVMPKLAKNAEALSADARRHVLEEMHQTTERAGDGVNPARRPSGSRTPSTDRSWGELIAEEMAAASR
jgi:hypothetical protein